MTRIGIIGGSGLENPEILKSATEKTMDTPYGQPSSPVVCGTIGGNEVYIISRHGHSHTIPPTEVNNRANIYALKESGCKYIITTTACGSLREDIRRGDLVVPDQFIDFTRHRKVTFFDSFEPGDMKHTAMADPFSEYLRNLIIDCAGKAGHSMHAGGTIITIEGPRFSTRAESKMFRLWGADLINMSTAPEVILANEAGLQYATIAMSTDYDSWKEDEVPVSWEDVISVFNRNTGNVTGLLTDVIKRIEE